MTATRGEEGHSLLLSLQEPGRPHPAKPGPLTPSGASPWIRGETEAHSLNTRQPADPCRPRQPRHGLVPGTGRRRGAVRVSPLPRAPLPLCFRSPRLGAWGAQQPLHPLGSLGPRAGAPASHICLCGAAWPSRRGGVAGRGCGGLRFLSSQEPSLPQRLPEVQRPSSPHFGCPPKLSYPSLTGVISSARATRKTSHREAGPGRSRLCSPAVQTRWACGATWRGWAGLLGRGLACEEALGAWGPSPPHGLGSVLPGTCSQPSQVSNCHHG